MLYDDNEWLSVCCYASPLYDIQDDQDEPIGLCSHCRDNTSFEKNDYASN